MKNFCRYLITVIMFYSSSLVADDYIEWVGANSGVNWTTGAATAEGAGLAKQGTPASLSKMMACRAALVDAQRNLLEALQGVRVEGITIVENLMVKSDIIKSSVQGTLQGAIMTSRRPQEDGTCEVSISAPLTGNFARNVYQTVAGRTGQSSQNHNALDSFFYASIDHFLDYVVAPVSANEGSNWRAPFDRLSERLTALEKLLNDTRPVKKQAVSAPTGLVIDARGSNFIPSMSPKIRKIRAGVIYPNLQEQHSYAARGQLVSLFTRDVTTARQHPIVGERPVVLKALRTWGDTRTEIVLNTEASKQLEQLISDGLMQDAGVIIVL